jgi:hypothetical protein
VNFCEQLTHAIIGLGLWAHADEAHNKWDRWDVSLLHSSHHVLGWTRLAKQATFALLALSAQYGGTAAAAEEAAQQRLTLNGPVSVRAVTPTGHVDVSASGLPPAQLLNVPQVPHRCILAFV